MADALNARFANGRASNELADAGVMVHEFDTTEDHDRPWLPCPEHGYNNWCHRFSDRWATSILNPQQHVTYFAWGGASSPRTGVGGVVLSPRTTEVFCAYPVDGNSMSEQKVCTPLGGDDRCIPGCYPRGQQCQEVGHTWTCSYPPSMLKEALEAQLSRADYVAKNNEIVVDTRSITSSLPGSIEAFFLVPNSFGEERARVVDAWRAFRRIYGLVDESTIPPLLLFDVRRPGQPFSVVELE